VRPDEKPPTLAERALVLWDAVESERIPMEAADDIRNLCEYAARVRLHEYHEPRRITAPRQRRSLAKGGVAFSSNVYGEFAECAFCGFLLLPMRNGNARRNSGPIRWNDSSLAIARSHTDRCALRFLINRKSK
jgi:hypothetical protein